MSENINRHYLIINKKTGKRTTIAELEVHLALSAHLGTKVKYSDMIHSYSFATYTHTDGVRYAVQVINPWAGIDDGE